MDQDNDRTPTASPVTQPSPTESTPAETPSTTVDSTYTQHDIKLPRERHHSKVALALGIALSIVLLAIGGIAIWFFAFYNHPDKVLADAITNFYQAENVVFDGGFAILPQNDETSIKQALLDFDLSSTRLPLSTEATLLVVFNQSVVGDGLDMIKLKLGMVWLADGAIYLQLGGIHDTIENLDLDEDDRLALQAYLDTFEQIDNEWWRISVPDIIDELGLSEPYDQALNDMYSCVLSAASDSDLSYLAPLYRNHDFIHAEPVKKFTLHDDESNYTEPLSGYNGYEITIDRAKLADFVNASYDHGVENEVMTCFNTVASKYNLEEFDLDRYEVSADDFEFIDNFKLYVEISRFGHQLRSLQAGCSEQGYNYSFSLLFKYQDAVVTAPNTYRPITELFDTIVENFLEFSSPWEDVNIYDEVIL